MNNIEAIDILNNSIKPTPLLKKPKVKSIPPIRTMSMDAQVDFTTSLPQSVIELIRKHKPKNSAKADGIPDKIISANRSIKDFKLITSYMVSKKNTARKIWYEFLIDTKMQSFWLMALATKPNMPYFVVMTSEEDTGANAMIASYFAMYYKHLGGGSKSLVKWYRSIEYVPYRKAPSIESKVIIIQCRWPSWAESRVQVYRTLVNIRAAYENCPIILLIDEEDLSIVPKLLMNEPYGLFFKFGLKDQLIPIKSKKRQRPSSFQIIEKIKRV